MSDQEETETIRAQAIETLSHMVRSLGPEEVSSLVIVLSSFCRTSADERLKALSLAVIEAVVSLHTSYAKYTEEANFAWKQAGMPSTGRSIETLSFRMKRRNYYARALEFLLEAAD